MDKMFDLDLQLSSSQGDTTPNSPLISLNVCVTMTCTSDCPTWNPCVSAACASAQCSGDPCVMPYGDDI